MNFIKQIFLVMVAIVLVFENQPIFGAAYSDSMPLNVRVDLHSYHSCFTVEVLEDTPYSTLYKALSSVTIAECRSLKECEPLFVLRHNGSPLKEDDMLTTKSWRTENYILLTPHPANDDKAKARNKVLDYLFTYCSLGKKVAEEFLRLQHIELTNRTKSTALASSKSLPRAAVQSSSEITQPAIDLQTQALVHTQPTPAAAKRAFRRKCSAGVSSFRVTSVPDAGPRSVYAQQPAKVLWLSPQRIVTGAAAAFIAVELASRLAGKKSGVLLPALQSLWRKA